MLGIHLYVTTKLLCSPVDLYDDAAFAGLVNEGAGALGLRYDGAGSLGLLYD